MRWKRIFSWSLCWLLAAAFILCPSWAQEEEVPSETPASIGDTPAEERIERLRSDMTASLTRLEDLQQDLADREQELVEAKSGLAAAQESDDAVQIEAARATIALAEDWVLGLRDEIEDEQRLYDRTAGRYQIAREQATLADGEITPQTTREDSPAALLETIQRRGELTQAEQEAQLAQQRVESLRAEVEIIENRQEDVRSDFDRINRRLDEGRALDWQQRQNLSEARQWLIDEERSFEDRLYDLRGQLIVADITLRIKEEEAERELVSYRSWQRRLLLSLSLLLTAVLLLLLARFLVSRFVQDPDRRYAANRTLSLALTFVLLIGLGLIFLRQFPNLITGIGVVLAGVAIALQEVILSFFGFFAIRGARGYRVGDWIRVGTHYGEVVDIGLLVTLLEEVTPIDIQGQQGGTKTGALTWINNSAIFREKVTNYIRGFPYTWCALTFTITFESNWKKAEDLLRDVLASHEEITTTAKLARKRVSEAAANLAIKVDDTSPRIRAWAADSGISLRVRFMVHPRRRRALIDIVRREVMTQFLASSDIDFAYNTTRVIPTPVPTEA